jgi:hypothetical protein
MRDAAFVTAVWLPGAMNSLIAACAMIAATSQLGVKESRTSASSCPTFLLPSRGLMCFLT